MNSDKNFVSLKELNNSLKTIDNLENYLNTNTFINIILNIEADLKKISFEHGDCFGNYTALIDSIMTKLNSIKEETTKLSTAIKNTVNNFESVNFRKTDLEMSANNVTKIPPVESANTNESEGINTVPIGLGIAATGIAGSVGAVIVDAHSYKPSPTLEKYEEEKEYIEEKIDKDDSKNEDDFVAADHKFDDVTPYHAARDKEISSKFYDE